MRAFPGPLEGRSTEDAILSLEPVFTLTEEEEVRFTVVLLRTVRRSLDFVKTARTIRMETTNNSNFFAHSRSVQDVPFPKTIKKSM